MLCHGWTLKTLCWMKQAGCRRPYIVWFHWYELSRAGKSRVRKKLSGCWRISGRRVWKKWRLTANGYSVSLWRDENVPQSWQRLYSCEYAKNDRTVDFNPVDVQYVLLLLLSRFSRVQLCATPETAAHQAPPSLGFSRQEHWSGLPFPSPVLESEKWKWSRSVVSDS